MLQHVEEREREIQRERCRAQRDKSEERASKKDFRAVLTDAREETECLHYFSISINPCLLGAMQF